MRQFEDTQEYKNLEKRMNEANVSGNLAEQNKIWIEFQNAQDAFYNRPDQVVPQPQGYSEGSAIPEATAMQICEELQHIHSTNMSLQQNMQELDSRVQNLRSLFDTVLS